MFLGTLYSILFTGVRTVVGRAKRRTLFGTLGTYVSAESTDNLKVSTLFGFNRQPTDTGTLCSITRDPFSANSKLDGYHQVSTATRYLTRFHLGPAFCGLGYMATQKLPASYYESCCLQSEHLHRQGTPLPALSAADFDIFLDH